MFNALKEVMELYNVRFGKLAGVTAYAAPSMIGKYTGLVAF